MVESAVFLDLEQRQIVESVVREHCEIRRWTLHAVNCRTNHCHVVVSAPNYDGEQVRDQLKSWGKRRLKKRERQLGVSEEILREHWWTRKGSVRYLFDDDSLVAATEYALDAQDVGGSKAN
ncbi:transposase [Roseimaritima ulvae]|nr:transposase [Roseimaritima ulvae]